MTNVAAARALAYDVVVMDVMMPEMDGVEATRLIRQLPAPVGTIPILGLTAHVSDDDYASFRAAGMDVVVNKPVTRKMLAAALDRVTADLSVSEAGL